MVAVPGKVARGKRLDTVGPLQPGVECQDLNQQLGIVRRHLQRLLEQVAGARRIAMVQGVIGTIDKRISAETR
jgi:hypothetical protein